MSVSVAFSLLTIRKPFLQPIKQFIQRCSYQKKDVAVSTVPKKKKIGKLGPMMEKKVLPVETDPEKLVSIVCGSNILKTGQDVPLRPDSEYPEWLWTLRTGPPLPLEELDKESKEYWRRIRSLGMKRNNKLSKLKKF